MISFPNIALDQPTPGQVLGKAALRAAERLGLSARQFARVTGLSEPGVSRLKRGTAGIEEGSKTFELAAMLVRLYRSLDAITGGDEAVARAWISAPNEALGAAPVEKITSVQGLVDVCAYLDSRRARL
ncbi:antitoxin Xre/MbcA/ParS toxin-binding domain-containing protein [Paracoccus sp. IB05]|uniref:antitoxin Xre/MbcA/ParS toxin-binding domain-containing protein n=1 Tax=Paracoccus sp. IB05 TaxID=2779367 RepID=UPI0018E7F7E9|nr:antitoxin Xre/MbcA/ParS toxin-binding domain-containing protein [Paracoccus sp. IB05]MBJ2151193.1 DUF2384 domain-containing protein [Paracoccus sp. IB05]